jgi:hypothetical protein
LLGLLLRWTPIGRRRLGLLRWSPSQRRLLGLLSRRSPIGGRRLAVCSTTLALGLRPVIADRHREIDLGLRHDLLDLGDGRCDRLGIGVLLTRKIRI